MNTKQTAQWIVVILMALVLNGCASVRYASTLKPSGDRALQLGGTRVNLVAVSIEARKGQKGNDWIWGNTKDITQRTRYLYPDIFTDEWTGLPLTVKIHENLSTGWMELASFLSGLTLGTIPFPGKNTYAYSVETSLSDAVEKPVAPGKVTCKIDQVLWWTLLFPFGLIAIPGEADLPRDRVYLTPPYSVTPTARADEYVTDCIVEAIVKSLRTMDQTQLGVAYQARTSRLQEIALDGKPCWSFLVARPSSQQDRMDVLAAQFYQDRPRRDAKPFDEVVVARRDASGAWHPVNGYLRTAGSLTAVSVLMENNAPSKVVARTIDEPPLEDFIATPDLSGGNAAANLRWSNGVLLDAKNRSLEKVLREESREGLLGLVTRIEQAILDLSEKAEQAKDRAQTKVEKGEGDPAPDRELAVLLRQRIEVLKPILSALKQEASLRKQ